MTSQEPVIHFLRILLRHRRFGEKRFIHRYRRKFPAISITAPRNLIQLRPRKRTMHQIDTKILVLIVQTNRCQHHMEPRQIVCVEGKK